MTANVRSVEFFDTLRTRVEREACALRQGIQRELERPLAERVARGRCVSGVKYLGAAADGMLRFECAENHSDFREGDRVRLHQGNPHESVALLVWAGDGLLAPERERIDLMASGERPPMRLVKNETYILDAAYLDLTEFFRAALEELARTERGRDRILPLLMGQVPEENFSPEEYEAVAEGAAEAGFNDEQQEAIAEGAGAERCCLIQGPPGTGKTRVLAQIVKARVARGERVLVTACTHRAIHEALRAISRALPEFERVAKVGTPVRDPGLPVGQFETFADLPFADEAGAYVIGATPFAARSKRLSGVDFETVMIDEASQMTLPLAVMAMLSADTYVIIGDPQQLPPVVLSVRPNEAVEHSLFRHLGRRREQIQLATTYRMNAPLTQWVGERFYLGNLRSWSGARDRRLRARTEDLPKWLQEVLDPSHSLVWIPTRATSTRHYSREEAALLTQIVAALYQAGITLSDVGVVTPFRRQAREIRRRLRQSREVPTDLSDAVVIDTVERMQGQEREVICISTAASDAGFIEAIGEFLYLPQRLNVAVSRARTKAIILASEPLLSSTPAGDGLIEGLEHWASLRDGARIVEV